MDNNIKKKFNNPFISLKHTNYRYYLMSMCISLIGTWMQNIAQPWLAYSITKSPLLLSVVGAMQFLPMLLFSLFAGVIIDQFPKKKIIILTQLSSLIITLVLAVLVWTGQVQYWHILVAALAIGFVNTLDMPTRQAFVIELVGKEDLMNAVALNSTIFNLARIIGPALAGLTMGYLGIAACFFINALSFGAVIIALLFIKPLHLQTQPKIIDNVIENIKDGLKYIKNNSLLLKTIISVFIIGTFAMNFGVLVPVFSTVVLHQQEAGFGFLMSFMGIGSFLGAMSLATMSKSGPKKYIMQLFPFLIAILLIFTGLTNSYFATTICIAATGFCFVSFSSTANSILQFNTEDEYRGRVMSIYTLVFGGSTPIGNLFAGFITNHFGASAGFISCGIMIIFLLLLLYIWKSNISNYLKLYLFNKLRF